MSRFSDDDCDIPPTRLVRNKTPNPTLVVEPTENDAATRKLSFEPVGNIGSNVPAPAVHNPAPVLTPAKSAESNQTVVFRPTTSGIESSLAKPTVAWLVVIAGPGKGTSLSMSYGLHKIGRDIGQDLVLDLGDEKISRQHHAAIEYDPKLRKFYLTKGENLVYLNDARVGAGTECELNTGDRIELGDTTLQFIAFCGVDFDWHTS